MPRRTEQDGRRAALQLAAWLVAIAAATGLLSLLRDVLDKAHFALAYLLVVLAAASRAGRIIGIGSAVVCFLCFNFFLLPPYYTFSIHETVDWFVLGAFLVTALIGAELLARANAQTRAAEQRADEIDRLSVLGAETLNAGRAEEAVGAIADVIRTTLDLGSCEIHGPAGSRHHCIAAAVRAGFLQDARSPLDEMLHVVLEHGSVALRRADGAITLDPRTGQRFSDVFAAHPDCTAFLFPLRVRGSVVGLLRLEHQEPIRLDAAQRRFMEVLAFYAALGVERVRLLAEAERVETLREADRLKDAVLAAVSHDLRTPLTTIKGLAHELVGNGDERAAIIVEEADRLNRFVADLLDLSRLNSGGIPLQLALNTADDLIAGAVQQTTGILGDHELRAAIPPGDILAGRFDSVHALRALTNLIENAAKYAPRGSIIELWAERAGERLLLHVADRGPGIPPADRDRIFEPFVRLGATPDTGGSGLGLAIARRLARAQHGDVTVQDRAGGGSIFTLALPAEQLPA